MSAIDKELVGMIPNVASCRFLNKAEIGDVDIEVSDIHFGNRLSSANAKITQKGTTIALIRATYSSPKQSDIKVSSFEHSYLNPTPTNDALVLCSKELNNSCIDLLTLKESSSWAIGLPPNGMYTQGGWTRFSDLREPDLKSLSYFGDGMPPTCLDVKSPRKLLFAATYELMIFYRRAPSKGWLRGQSVSKLLHDDVCDMDTEIFDGEGNLVCQAKQVVALKFAKHQK